MKTPEGELFDWLPRLRASIDFSPCVSDLSLEMIWIWWWWKVKGHGWGERELGANEIREISLFCFWRENFLLCPQNKIKKGFKQIWERAWLERLTVPPCRLSLYYFSRHGKQTLGWTLQKFNHIWPLYFRFRIKWEFEIAGVGKNLLLKPCVGLSPSKGAYSR
jgi:hypothetical protein